MNIDGNMEPVVVGKAAVNSWTVWLNVTALIFVGAMQLPEVVAVIPAAALPYLVAVVAVVNLALRYFVTAEPITGFLKPKRY